MYNISIPKKGLDSFWIPVKDRLERDRALVYLSYMKSKEVQLKI